VLIPREEAALLAYCARFLPDLTPAEPDGTLRFIEPLRPGLWGTPWIRLRALEAVLDVEDTEKSGFRVVEEADLLQAVALQTGLEDAPGFDPSSAENLAAVVGDLLGYLDRGWPLVQYEVAWEPDWYREVTGSDLPDAPEGWITIEAVAALKGVAARTVKENAPTMLTARRCAGNQWYVKPDERLDRWAAAVPDWGTTAFRTCAVVAAAEALVSVGRGADPADAVYRVAEDVERRGHGISGYYERHTIERYLGRHYEDPAVLPTQDGEALQMPTTAAEWARRGPNLVAVARHLADQQVEAAVQADAIRRTVGA
jgi:hypothetical protein